MGTQKLPRIRWIFALSLVVTMLFGVTDTALAAEFRSGDTVTVGPNEVIDDDLIVAGRVIVVEGVINGDLVAAGQQIVVNGTVHGSLIMAGRSLAINGQVDRSVYSLGAVLTVKPGSVVERNLFFAGYSYQTDKASNIGRDTVVAGYQGMLNGNVQRDLYAAFTALELNGVIQGDVNATVERPGTTVDVEFWRYANAPDLPPALVPGLRVSPAAEIGGQLRYASAIDQGSAIQSQPAQGVIYTAPASAPAVGPAAAPVPALANTPVDQTINWLWAQLNRFVSLLLIGVLVLWLMPTPFAQAAARVQAQPGLASAWGLLVGIGGYIGALLIALILLALVVGFGALTLAGLAAGIFGLGFGLLGVGFTLFLLAGAYISKLVVIYALSNAIFARTLPPLNHYRIVLLTVGIVLFILVRTIPYLGVLVDVVITLIGLGAIWLAFRQSDAKPAAPALVLAPA